MTIVSKQLLITSVLSSMLTLASAYAEQPAAVPEIRPGLLMGYAGGSIDVWFGPTLPEGVNAANWGQTIPGKGWNALFRLYGPLQPWFDKTWRVGEFELVK